MRTGGLGGAFALEARESLARKMTSGWPRRGRKLLEIHCGDGYFLEAFWQSGFDVTGQERDPGLLEKARRRLKQAAEFTLGHEEHLPYDDGAFDYVICLNGLAFAPDPQDLLDEMFRLATAGILLAFPSAWSCHGLGQNFSPKASEKPVSPWKIYRRLRALAPEGRPRWAANLLGPSASWRGEGILARLNRMSIPLPLGAFSLVRLDLPAAQAGNPLFIRSSRSLAREAAANGLSRNT
ncbi:MAG: class I SAM-dependent methyltransferase [Desulfovibrionaceae bacterium]|nr:class I SAM-dependent methyltransferase [Desulfovibrionaceae bacterium]